MQLRDYQEDLKSKIYEAWDDGATNVLVQLATGGGKTAVFSKIISENKSPSIAIAHRTELVSQISITLARYGIYHNLIAQKNTIREIIALHMFELGRNYYNPRASCFVAGVDTLIRLPESTEWFKNISLVVQDEGHHPLKNNKWGKAAKLFPNARGLYPTATPVRADGRGLGSHADGIADALIVGTSMRDLILRGYLTDYRIFAPPSDLDLSSVSISAGGDYSPPKLRSAVHKSHITGDVVSHYLKFARGKLGVTFAVDIDAATEIAKEFRNSGVSAEIISSKTPDLLRSQIMSHFRKKEILQIVNVDLLGEGVDVPAIEVVSMARPTQSFGLYSQQFGRALRPMPGKNHAIIIDHVGNVVRHGLPDARRNWSLDRAERRPRGVSEITPVRVCLNKNCMAIYERTKRICPFCGYYSPPQDRSAPEYVDGDLFELDKETLAKLRGEINRIDLAARIPQGADHIVKQGIINRHTERQIAQRDLRNSIATWAAYEKLKNKEDCEIYRIFYFTFGIDIGTAQTLGSSDANKLKLSIDELVNLN